MSIFDLHASVVQDYQRYVQSFLSIADDRIRQFVETKLLQENVFWPDALLQLNPSYQLAQSVDDLAAAGTLTAATASIFRTSDGVPIRLYKHQCDAISRASKKQSYVVTSGTGSGKSLTYFIPIFDAILRANTKDHKVWAIVIYPMNALVNSQFESLSMLRQAYQARTGQPMPVRFEKYTGQEDETAKIRIQQERPHILLTNFMMLEMMLLRPQESAFVDKATSGLQFLVLDELHMYRGRQGADVAMLVRRLKERCGNPDLLHIGTSATMVAHRSVTGVERRTAVGNFAGKLFGTSIAESNVIEETLVPVSNYTEPVTADELRKSIEAPLPQNASELLATPLASWVESTVGIEKDAEGVFRRKVPQSLSRLASALSETVNAPVDAAEQKLRQLFLAGSRIKQDGGSTAFAFKLHQFISQGRAVYGTIEGRASRFLTLDGQYYAPPSPDGFKRLLYPMLFCRVCGQEYYRVKYDESQNVMSPWTETAFEDGNQDGRRGYLMLPPSEPFDWSNDDLPPEWLEANGKVRQNYRNRVPRSLHVQPDGAVLQQPSPHSVRVYFQDSPFLICQSCGEYYTLRDRDFRKLTGLSNEGRSSATTTLGISALDHAGKAGITGPARKLLSFTDNRQDASLQAGHFNDFVLVSLLRAAIYDALKQHGELRHHEIADKTVASLGLKLSDIAQNPQLDPHSALAATTWKAFRDLVEYRIYEDLRRAWRVVHPNLEQCGLLRVEYDGLETCAERDDLWAGLLEMAALTKQERINLLTPLLDFARKKLAIHAASLHEVYQQQLRRRVNEVINERWCFDPEEQLRCADRLILPGQAAGRLPGISLGARSLVGRYLRRKLDIGHYDEFIRKLVSVLVNQGLLRRDTERGVEFVQLQSAVLVWKKGTGEPPPPDPIYSRRAASDIFIKVQQAANEYFREMYQHRAHSLRDVEGLEHTAQVKYENREERERRFREGDLKVLFCSPTMELGIDISDLQLVHLRNVPPSPASYAQRSGRAGRKGDPALILTYCSALSGHDQYFFRRREEIVAGSVRPPRIDLSNEDMVRAHMHAVWFAKVNLKIERSMDELLDLQREDLPLKENVKAQIQLSEARLAECIAEGRRILDLCSADLADAAWYRPDWLEDTIRHAANAFDRAFDRWRQLFQAATKQLRDAQQQEATALDPKVQAEARQKVEEAKRQRNLLTNIGTTRQESDFYPYRYLASEGFLPGYNFPRLPIRVYIPREEGEFISRARFLAITEFGPGNLIYHEGAKYQLHRFWVPPGGLGSRRAQAKLCSVCGYYNASTDDRCSGCKTVLDGSTSLFVNLLEMPDARTIRRSRITCDEEERVRRGYETSTHFRFASAGGQTRTVEATVGKDPAQPLMRAVYGPQATLYRINHGWKRQADGFTVNLANGEINPSAAAANQQPANHQDCPRLRLFVNDTENILLVYPPAEIQQNDRAVASLQFALQRGMEQYFQIEESELASERIGTGDRRAILYWEAAEGGVGILRRMVEEANLFAAVAAAALDRLHFDGAGADKNADCTQACYECILSYSNQQDHWLLDRHLVRDLLLDLIASTTTKRHGGRDYEAHYQWLKSLTDSRSELERRFLEHLYKTRRDLPDEAQKALTEVNTIPDFYYDGQHACIFCDGSVHDDPAQKEKDIAVRQLLRNHGYRVIVIRYDKDMEQQIAAYPDLFGFGKMGATA
ncbi:MAG: DEAD/DEAH box helicase [Bryobacteraceae bacterium]|nr:DEAD/DEAH box helicase [Bryobacteraceae bacterium]